MVATLSACTGSNPSLSNCGAVIREYVVRDGQGVTGETARLLVTLGLEQQFEIYHCSARRMMPPLTDLAVPFAMQGGQAGLFLIDKVNNAPDDATVLSGVELLATMRQLGTFNAADDEAQMVQLVRRVQSMRNANARMAAQSEMRVLWAERDG
jgi:hypothetical protein